MYHVNDAQLRKIGLTINALKVFINDSGQLVLGGNGCTARTADDALRRFKYALEDYAAAVAEHSVKAAKAKFAILQSALKPDAKMLLISIL